MSNNKTNDNRYMWSRFALSQCYIDQWNFCSMGFYYFHFLYYVSLQIYANFRLDLPVCIVIRADYEIQKSDDWWLFLMFHDVCVNPSCSVKVFFVQILPRSWILRWQTKNCESTLMRSDVFFFRSTNLLQLITPRKFFISFYFI